MTIRELIRSTLQKIVLASCVTTALACQAFAQSYPSKPITLLVGYGAGGTADTASHMLAEGLGAQLGVTVIVRNSPGGEGILALNEMLRADHDGYTIALLISDLVFSSTYQQRLLDLDTFAMIGGFMSQERVLFASARAPFKTVEDFVAYAKGTPVTFADGGSFSSARVIEAFAKKLRLQLRIAPLKSGLKASDALISGKVMLAETGVGSSAWFEARKPHGPKILATLSAGDLNVFDLTVASLRSSGSDFAIEIHSGLVTPADVPSEHLTRLRDALKRVVADPSLQARFRAADLPLSFQFPTQFHDRIARTAGVAKEVRAYLAN